jgi:hypothetical protein
LPIRVLNLANWQTWQYTDDVKATDLSSWYTLEQTIDKLQTSARSVYRLRDEQKIRWATRREKGVRPTPVYNPDDVEAIRKSRDEKVVAKIAPPNAENGELTKATTTTTTPKTLMRAATREDSFGLFMEFIQRGMATQSAVSQVRLFMTIKEASAYSGLSQALLRRLCKNSVIPSLKDQGVKIAKSDIDLYAGPPEAERDVQLHSKKTRRGEGDG